MMLTANGSNRIRRGFTASHTGRAWSGWKHRRRWDHAERSSVARPAVSGAPRPDRSMAGSRNEGRARRPPPAPLSPASIPWQLAIYYLAIVQVAGTSIVPACLQSLPRADSGPGQRHTPHSVRCSALALSRSIAGHGGGMASAPGSCRGVALGDAAAAGRGGGDGVGCRGRGARGGVDGRGLRVRDIGLVAAGQVRLRHLRLGTRIPPQPGS